MFFQVIYLISTWHSSLFTVLKISIYLYYLAISGQEQYKFIIETCKCGTIFCWNILLFMYTLKVPCNSAINIKSYLVYL